jgi:two-component system cell cycle response regulator DivK
MADKTALIIDDNQSNLNVLQMMLSKNGVRAIAIPSPHQLGAALEAHPPFDVIFLDLEFPNYSGYDLVGQLKARGDLDNTPIIAYSVHNSELREIRDAGFDGFLGKPLQPHQFADQLARILRHESVWEF